MTNVPSPMYGTNEFGFWFVVSLAEQLVAVQQVCLSHDAQFICHRRGAFAHRNPTRHFRQPGGYGHWSVECNVPSGSPIISDVLMYISPPGMEFTFSRHFAMTCRTESGHWCSTHMTSKTMYGCAIQVEGNATTSPHSWVHWFTEHGLASQLKAFQTMPCFTILWGHCRNLHWTLSRRSRHSFRQIRPKSSR